MKKILFLTAALGLLVLSSCNDWLDVKPRSESPEKDMFQSETGFKDALIACYIKMNDPSAYGLSLTAKEIDVLANYWSFGVNVSSTELPILNALKSFNYENEDVQKRFAATYTTLYNTISQANLVLTNLERTGETAVKDPGLRAIIKAEALSVRAFCHMDILRLFGQVPTATAKKMVQLPYSEGVSKETPPYYGFSDFVDKILKDFDEAEALLKEHDPLLKKNPEREGETDPYYQYHDVNEEEDFLSYRRFRFNYYSVLALKARLYLYVGKTAQAHDYALRVIAESRLPLAGTPDLSAEFFSLPNECIMALSAFQISINMRNTSGGRNNLLDPNVFYMSASNVNNRLFPGMLNHNRYTYLWNMQASDEQTRTRPNLKKYDQTATSNDILALALWKQVIPIVRLSEMFLIVMETSESLAEVNACYDVYLRAREMARSDFATLDEARMEVINEYSREFIGEGQMFYTYKRKNSSSMMFYSGTMDEDKYVVPLPLTESGHSW